MYDVFLFVLIGLIVYTAFWRNFRGFLVLGAGQKAKPQTAGSENTPMFPQRREQKRVSPLLDQQ